MVLRCANILEEKGFFIYYFLGKDDNPLGIQIKSKFADTYLKGMEYFFDIRAKDVPKKEEHDYVSHF